MKPSKYIAIGLIMWLAWLAEPRAAFALSALDPWNAEARDGLPIHVKIWLGLMMLNNLASLGFVKNHVAARWVFAGFFVSHAIVMWLWSQQVEVLAGQVSLFHVLCWTPGVIWIVRKRAEIKFPAPYAIWAALACLFYTGSMFVDIRDAFLFLSHSI